MKRIVKRDYHYFGPAVELFRDDLDEIIEVLSESGSGDLSISDSEFVYDTLDEMMEKRGERPSVLEIECEMPHINVKVARFRKGGSVCIFTDASEESQVAFRKVREIFQQRRRLLSRFLDRRVWGLLMVAAVLLPFSVVPIWLNLLLLLFSCLFFLLSLAVHNGFLSLIHLKRRHELSTFWSRNSEKIVIGLVLLILGGFIKTGLDWFLSFFGAL